MRSLFPALLLVGPLAAAPTVKEKPAPPITPKNVQDVREVATIGRDAFRLGWVPDTGDLAVMPWEGDVELLDRKTFKPVGKLAAGKRLVKFAFSRDGAYLGWAENNSSVTVEDRKTGKAITIETGNSQPDIVFSPDSKWLVTGGYGNLATLWDVATGKKLRDFDTGTKGGLTPVFSPDGKVLAVGNRNSDPKLFDPETGKELFTLPKRMTQEIRFNPAGTVLATTYVDGSLGLWDVATGKLLGETKTTGEELYTVDWSPKGDLLVTAGLNAKIILWDPAELKPLRELDAPPWVIKAKFSPDGSRLVTAGGNQQRDQDRKITVWGLGDGR